jgi:hypothetical protein
MVRSSFCASPAPPSCVSACCSQCAHVSSTWRTAATVRSRSPGEHEGQLGRRHSALKSNSLHGVCVEAAGGVGRGGEPLLRALKSEGGGGSGGSGGSGGGGECVYLHTCHSAQTVCRKRARAREELCCYSWWHPKVHGWGKPRHTQQRVLAHTR